MARRKRNTVTYDLKRGRKVVYRGTTNDPERREQEHRVAGKKFTHMLITSPKLTEESARKRESDSLSTYRHGHEGRNPEYNKDSDG